MGHWTQTSRRILGLCSHLLLIHTHTHLDRRRKHFKISRKAVSATHNYQCSWSVRADVRMNTLIMVIVTAASIGPLQYVGCINVSGTDCACVKALLDVLNDRVDEKRQSNTVGVH